MCIGLLLQFFNIGILGIDKSKINNGFKDSILPQRLGFELPLLLLLRRLLQF
jgi:hypothetical protein